MLGFRPQRPIWAKLLYLGSILMLLGLLGTAFSVAILPGWNPLWFAAGWFPVTFLAVNTLLLLVQLRQ